MSDDAGLGGARYAQAGGGRRPEPVARTEHTRTSTPVFDGHAKSETAAPAFRKCFMRATGLPSGAAIPLELALMGL